VQIKLNPASRAARTCSTLSWIFSGIDSPGKYWLVTKNPSFTSAPFGYLRNPQAL
jgi:hypothetical protein